MDDPHRLERFVEAQDRGGAYGLAVAELRSGRKRGHWMWFVFPQISGLGQSPMSRRYAIASLEEARAYFEHPLLGPRLTECARIISELDVGSAEEIFGGIDAIKLRSSLTLFARANPGDALFPAVLNQYFGGQADPATDRLLS